MRARSNATRPSTSTASTLARPRRRAEATQ
jgi:hypothetical protein